MCESESSATRRLPTGLSVSMVYCVRHTWLAFTQPEVSHAAHKSSAASPAQSRRKSLRRSLRASAEIPSASSRNSARCNTHTTIFSGDHRKLSATAGSSTTAAPISRAHVFFLFFRQLSRRTRAIRYKAAPAQIAKITQSIKIQMNIH